jgi:hypothetical protein
MASGIPWPRMIGAQRAMVAIINAPIAAAIGNRGEGSRSESDGISPHPHSPSKATCVMRLIVLTNRYAAPPAAPPTMAARPTRSRSRRVGTDTNRLAINCKQRADGYSRVEKNARRNTSGTKQAGKRRVAPTLSYYPRHDLRVLRVSAGTSPIGNKSGSDHDEDMDIVVAEIISTYMGPYASPGLLLAAAAGIVVLLSGLGARIVELGQVARWAHQDSNRKTFSPAVAADRSPRSSRRTTANTNRGSRPIYGDPSDKMTSGVCSVRAPIIRPHCVLNGSNGRGPASTPLHESKLLVTDLRQGFGHPHHRRQRQHELRE